MQGSAAVKRKPRGKPFVTGDPRHNLAGRPKAVLSSAARKLLTSDQCDKVAQQLIDQAVEGDLKAIELLWNRIEGKAVERQEQGDPGAFEGLADVSTEELLRIVKKAS